MKNRRSSREKMMKDVLAGGKGERLHSLMIHRTNDAVFQNIYVIEKGSSPGYNPEEDRKRFSVRSGGVVVIPKGAEVR